MASLEQTIESLGNGECRLYSRLKASICPADKGDKAEHRKSHMYMQWCVDDAREEE